MLESFHHQSNNVTFILTTIHLLVVILGVLVSTDTLDERMEEIEVGRKILVDFWRKE